MVQKDERKTELILISWLLQKPADQDLHCFQKSFSRIWIKRKILLQEDHSGFQDHGPRKAFTNRAIKDPLHNFKLCLPITNWLTVCSAFGDILTFVDTPWYTLKSVSSTVKDKFSSLKKVHGCCCLKSMSKIYVHAQFFLYVWQ